MAANALHQIQNDILGPSEIYQSAKSFCDDNNNDISATLSPLSKVTSASDTITINKLNEDCLIHILEYLNSNDLIKFSKIFPCFNEIISTHIFNKRPLKLGEIKENHSIRNVLKAFGPFLKHLEMSSTDVQYKPEYLSSTEEMFALIDVYCSKKILQSLSLAIEFEPAPESAFISIAPKFCQIEDMRLHAIYTQYLHFKSTVNMHDISIAHLLKHAKQMKRLTLLDLKITGSFLKQIPLSNLSELKIENCNHLCYASLTELFKNYGKNLKTFSFVNSKTVDFREIGKIIYYVCRLIGEYLPNVEEVSVIMNYSTTFCHPKTEKDYTVYDPLLNLKRLRKLTLGCAGACGCFDTASFVQRLSQQHTLENLSIESPMHWRYSSCVPSSKILNENLPYALADLINLKYLRLVDVCKYEDNLLQVIANNLVNLREFHLIGHRRLFHQKLIDFCVQMKQLTRIYVIQAKMDFTVDLYIKLMNACRKRPNLPIAIVVEKAVKNRLLLAIPTKDYQPNIVRILS